MSRYELVKKLLRKHKYRCIDSVDGPPDQIPDHDKLTRLEFWKGRKGTLILQRWISDGVSVFVDWKTGSSINDLEDEL